jgi:hypothetical protein
MMARLCVTEFAEMQIGPAGRQGQMPMQQPLATQGVVNTGASTQSAAFNAQSRFVRLETDTVCCIQFGTNPTAVAIGAGMTTRMAAGQTEYHAVPLGAGFKVAAVASA